MVKVAQATCKLPGTSRFLQLDGENPQGFEGLEGFEGSESATFDLICSSFAMQWFDDVNLGLQRLASYLAPGGRLVIATLAEDTFLEWRAAHHAEGLRASTRRFPAAADLGIGITAENGTKDVSGSVDDERLVMQEVDGLAFLRGLKHIGASTPANGMRPLSPSALKRVITRFNNTGATVTYHIAYGHWQKSRNDIGEEVADDEAARAQGIFVTGTDTGIGKTLVSAVLTCAWDADYWKPVQTGLADEAGDTVTVQELAALDASRLHAPTYALQASLSPWAAAPLEDVSIDATAIRAPDFTRTLIVEGAGGLYVPIDASTMMIDLIDKLGFPVVLVARSGLGTINHTLLSVKALRLKGVPVLGVVMVGALNPGNRHAIEQFGGCSVLLEIPHLDIIDATVVRSLASGVPSLASLLAGLVKT